MLRFLDSHFIYDLLKQFAVLSSPLHKSFCALTECIGRERACRAMMEALYLWPLHALSEQVGVHEPGFPHPFDSQLLSMAAIHRGSVHTYISSPWKATSFKQRPQSQGGHICTNTAFIGVLTSWWLCWGWSAFLPIHGVMCRVFLLLPHMPTLPLHTPSHTTHTTRKDLCFIAPLLPSIIFNSLLIALNIWDMLYKCFNLKNLENELCSDLYFWKAYHKCCIAFRRTHIEKC